MIYENSIAGQVDELVAAADAVVERWHSRDWKQPHTAEFIARLAAAVGEAKRASLTPTAPQAAEEQLRRMRAAFHVNMLRAFPNKTHAEIEAEIDKACGAAPQAATTASASDDDEGFFMTPDERAALARAPLPAKAPTDDEIESAALKHVATGWKQLAAVTNLDPDYRKGEQFKRLKAFALELLNRESKV